MLKERRKMNFCLSFTRSPYWSESWVTRRKLTERRRGTSPSLPSFVRRLFSLLISGETSYSSLGLRSLLARDGRTGPSMHYLHTDKKKKKRSSRKRGCLFCCDFLLSFYCEIDLSRWSTAAASASAAAGGSCNSLGPNEKERQTNPCVKWNTATAVISGLKQWRWDETKWINRDSIFTYCHQVATAFLGSFLLTLLFCFSFTAACCSFPSRDPLFPLITE